MQELATLIERVGVPVAILIYFMWKDMKMIPELTKCMNELKSAILLSIAKKEGS